MENEKRSTMKCPECGRTVLAEDLVCPDCGTLIDDTELDELEDLEQEYSDSFEEEYQNMHEDIPSFRNIHTNTELMHFDELIEVLRDACKEAEKQHIQNKRLYRTREKYKERIALPKEIVNLLPLAGSIYEKSRKHIRGVCWVRYIANLLHRGVPVDWIEEWDSGYFKKVLGWLPLKEITRKELIEAVENW